MGCGQVMAVKLWTEKGHVWQGSGIGVVEAEQWWDSGVVGQ